MKEINFENILLIGLLVLVVIGLIFAFSGFFKPSGKPYGNVNYDKQGFENKNDEEDKSPGFETKTINSEVSIDLTPRYENGKLYVETNFNTHSGDLTAYNLKELVKLEVNKETIAPSSAPSLSGHHTSGTFVFDLKNKPEQFTIKIRDIPDIKERIFRWP